jgi:hypothetical protein
MALCCDTGVGVAEALRDRKQRRALLLDVGTKSFRAKIGHRAAKAFTAIFGR